MKHSFRGFSNFGLMVSFVFLFTFTGALYAEEPKYKNPNTKFTPMSMKEAAKLAEKKRGERPKLSEKERKKIDRGRVIVRELSPQGDTRRFSAIGIIDAPMAEVMKIIKDYPGKVGRFPHVEKSSVKWDGAFARVNLVLNVAFQDIAYTLNYLHYGNAFVEWEYVEGDVKDISGYYKLFPEAGGKKTMMEYHVLTEIGFPIPDFIKDSLSKNSMPKVIKVFQKTVGKK